MLELVVDLHLENLSVRNSPHLLLLFLVQRWLHLQVDVHRISCQAAH